MSLLATTTASNATASYFDSLAYFHSAQSLRIFQQAKYLGSEGPTKDLRDQIMGQYEAEVAAGSSTPFLGGGATEAPIEDPRMGAIISKVINAKLSFGEKKIFIDELLAEYRATDAGKLQAFLDKVDDLLAAAENQSDFQGTTKPYEEQLLRLYYAQEAGGTTADAGQPKSLLDFLA